LKPGDSTPEPRDGAKPPIPDRCRAFLDAALAGDHGDAHAGQCGPCAARLAFHRRAADQLRQRPSLPRELTSPAFFASVQERLVAAIEQSSRVGELLADRESIAAPSGEWRDRLLESTAARAMQTPPTGPSDATWRDLRASIYSQVVHARSARPRWRWLTAAAAAAVAASAVWFMVPKGTPTTVTIVFADLDTAPSIDFAFVRRGPPR
jgi:hypothetical protein